MKKLTHLNRELLINSLLFIATFIAIFIPLSKPAFEYEWKPLPNASQIRIPLIEQTPDFFELNFDCSTGLKNDTWIINSIGGTPFQVNATRDLIQITTLNKETKELYNIQILRQVNSNDCVSKLTFEKNIWYLEEFGYKKSIKNNFDSLFEISNILEWNLENLGPTSYLKIKSEPFVFEYSNLIRNCIILSLLLFLFYQLIPKNILKIKNINLKLKNSEIIFLIYLMSLGFTTLPKTDDGGYLISARALREFAVYTIYYVPVSAPTGHLHALLNSIFALSSTPIIFGRIIPILSIFISYIIFNRKIIPQLMPIHNSKLNILVFSLFSLASASLITIRPEPIMVLLLTINLYLISIVTKSNASRILGSTFLIGTLAVSIHQTGIVVLSMTIILLIYSKIIGIYLKDLIKNIVPFISVSLLILFYWQTPIHAYYAYKQFRNSFEKIFPGQFNIIYPPWMEHKRLIHLLESNLSTSILKFLALTLLIQFILIGYIAIRKKLDTKEKLFYFASITSFLTLALVPTKWSLYYPIFLPIIALFLIIMYKKMTKKFNLVVFILLLIPTIISWSTNWSAQDSDWPLITLDITDSSFVSWLIENKVILLALFLSIMIIILISRDLIFSILIVNALVLVIFQNLPVIIDSYKTNNWSFIKSNIQILQNPLANCGMADYVNFEGENISTFIKNNPTAPEMIFYNHCTQLLDFRKGVWEFPEYGIGPVTVLDQQRLAVNTNITKLDCLELSSGEIFDRYCYFKWESDIPNLVKY